MNSEANETNGSARERLFDALLREQFRAHDADRAAAELLRATPGQREAAHRRAQAAEVVAPAWKHWGMAAAALLGVSVVVTTWLQSPPPAVGAQLPQDPPQAPEMRPRDLAGFLAALDQVMVIHIGGGEPIGATQIVQPNGASDALEIRCWPEMARVSGEALRGWRQAFTASAGGSPASGDSGLHLSLHFQLADGSRIEAGWRPGQPMFGYGWQLVPNEALTALLEAAGHEAEALHRRALGRVRDVAELAALPADARRIECPWSADGKMAERLARFSKLEEFVLAKGPGAGPDAAGLQQLTAIKTLKSLDLRAADLGGVDLAPLGELPALTTLALRGVPPGPLGRVAPRLTGLTLEGCEWNGSDGFLLRGCTSLRSLRLIDSVPLSSAAAVEIVSLPALADLTVRHQRVSRELFDALKLGKLQSLRLLDVPVSGAELAKLAELPTLRELSVLSPTIDDGEAGALAALRQLTTLRLMNVRVTPSGLADLQKALPKCTIDCVPGRRVFDSASWLVR